MEGGVSHLQNNSENLHQILLSRYFREELQQRIWGEACAWKTQKGSAWLHDQYIQGVKARDGAQCPIVHRNPHPPPPHTTKDYSPRCHQDQVSETLF